MNDINSFLINRIKASSKYVSSKLIHKNKTEDFIFTINRIIDVIKSNKTTQETLNPLKKKINKLETQFILSRTEDSKSIFNLINQDHKYEDYAFQMTYDILDKTEQRFITGYLNSNNDNNL